MEDLFDIEKSSRKKRLFTLNQQFAKSIRKTFIVYLILIGVSTYFLSFILFWCMRNNLIIASGIILLIFISCFYLVRNFNKINRQIKNVKDPTFEFVKASLLEMKMKVIHESDNQIIAAQDQNGDNKFTDFLCIFSHDNSLYIKCFSLLPWYSRLGLLIGKTDHEQEFAITFLKQISKKSKQQAN